MLPAQMSTINCCFKVPGCQGCVRETRQGAPPPKKKSLKLQKKYIHTKNIPARAEIFVVSRILDFSMSFYLDLLCFIFVFWGDLGFKDYRYKMQFNGKLLPT